MEKEVPHSDPEQLIKVDIVLDEYDFRSAKELVRKINEFFANPKKIICQLKRNMVANIVENKSNFIKLDFLSLLGKSGPNPKEKRVSLNF